MSPDTDVANIKDGIEKIKDDILELLLFVRKDCPKDTPYTIPKV